MPGTRADRNALKRLTAQHAPAQAPAHVMTLTQPLSPTYTPPAKPAPTIPEVGRRIEQELAHLPQVGRNSDPLQASRNPDRPLSAAQEAALDLLDALAGELARHLSPQVLADRLPALGTAAGQAVRNAISEAGQ